MQRYEQGQDQQARFAFQQLTAQCFACHSRLTHPQPFDLGQRFLTAQPLAQLPLRDQVRLAVATRQFETALETCETLFRSTTMTAAAIDLLGVFEDYLKMVLRVREDFVRAIATFEQLLGRADVTPDLRKRLQSWVVALQELQPQGFTGEALPRARALIEAGRRAPHARRPFGYIAGRMAMSLMRPLRPATLPLAVVAPVAMST